jgi:hypothetical protein
MGRRSRGATGCPQHSADPRPVGVPPVRPPSAGANGHESPPTAGWSVLATPCLALPFSWAIHGVMIPQPAGFEMSSRRKFNRLTAIEFSHKVIRPSGATQYYWFFRCDCSKVMPVLKSNVVRGYVKSCGCYKREPLINRNKTHGFGRRNKHRFYRILMLMLQRCNNPKATCYEIYGVDELQYVNAGWSLKNSGMTCMTAT